MPKGLMNFENDKDSPLATFKPENDIMIREILQECEKETENLLLENKDSLLKLIEKLKTVTKLNSPDFLHEVSSKKEVA